MSGSESRAEEKDIRPSELFLSCLTAIITALLLLTSTGPALIKPMLFDGSLISNGRFAFIYDGYETVGQDGAPSVVGIGSSIILAAMDGNCMQNESSVEDIRFYNFGQSGELPYTEMIQIPALIEANPDVVMIEVGPNSLYGWNGDPWSQLQDYAEFRLQLSSMTMSSKHIGGWYDVLEERDQIHVDAYLFGRVDAWSEYSRDAIEEYLRREIDNVSAANHKDNSYSFVPEPNSDGWDEYLSSPNYHISSYETMSPQAIRDDLDKRMDKKANQSVYKPKSNGTQNHNALDYIINELLNQSIPVVLVGIPHHPWVNEYLQPNQLDGMNETYNYYSKLENVTPLQMYWEEWPSEAFDNLNHVDAGGREIFCKRVTPIIDAVLNGDDPKNIEIDSSIYNIQNEPMINTGICLGNDQIFTQNGDIIEIEAEDYSHCLHGTWAANGQKWFAESSKSGFNGEGYLVAGPDSKIKVGDTTDGPRIGYNISFNQPGTYHVWVRMSAPNGSSDSIHVGLNGMPVTFGSTGIGIWNPNIGDEWIWKDTRGSRVTIDIPSTGIHQFYIWMREDGVRVDTFILTMDSEYNPETE